jgi:hypothetical protein
MVFPKKQPRGKKKYLVTKVLPRHLYQRTDFHLRVKLCVVEFLLASFKAAKHQGVFASLKFLFSNCECASTLK